MEESMKLSARNRLKGSIKQITPGTLNSEVVLEVAPGVEMVAMITKASRERLGLEVGQEVYAVIKASHIMLGLD